MAEKQRKYDLLLDQIQIYEPKATHDVKLSEQATVVLTQFPPEKEPDKEFILELVKDSLLPAQQSFDKNFYDASLMVVSNLIKVFEFYQLDIVTEQNWVQLRSTVVVVN